MGNPIIAIRSKALRGLGSVITVDPEVLAHVSSAPIGSGGLLLRMNSACSETSNRRAIIGRLAVSAGRGSRACRQVRGAKAQIVSRVLSASGSTGLSESLETTGPRSTADAEQDTGLGVRKRVIKLLRGISSTTTDRDIKVDICCKMVTLAGDTDDNIKVSRPSTL